MPGFLMAVMGGGYGRGGGDMPKRSWAVLRCLAGFNAPRSFAEF